jgi:hypothetical protein
MKKAESHRILGLPAPHNILSRFLHRNPEYMETLAKKNVPFDLSIETMRIADKK